MKNGGIASSIRGTDHDSSANIAASADHNLTTGRPGASRTLPRSPALSDPKVCSLYFIAGAGLIKIGISTSLTGRIRSIRNSSPVPLEVLAIQRGATQFNEMRLHGRFAKLRRHGEWFEDDGEIRAHIAELIRAGKAEKPA